VWSGILVFLMGLYDGVLESLGDAVGCECVFHVLHLDTANLSQFSEIQFSQSQVYDVTNLSFRLTE